MARAAWEELKEKAAAFTKEYGFTVVLSSTFGHTGTTNLTHGVQATLEESIRRSDEEVRSKQVASENTLTINLEEESIFSLRSRLADLVGKNRKNKYTPEKVPEWWARTGIPFMSPSRGRVHGTPKCLTKADLITLIRSANDFYERRDAREDAGNDDAGGPRHERGAQTPKAGGSGAAGPNAGRLNRVLATAFKHREVCFDRRKKARRNLFGTDDGNDEEDGDMMKALADDEPLAGIEEMAFLDLHFDDLKKIGEGTFGEVFIGRRNDEEVVAKIVPFDGDLKINEEEQKKWEDVKAEIVIAKELTKLRPRHTTSFCELKECKIVYGSYPQTFLDQWDVYNNRKGSENDRPDAFPVDQRYVVFVFNNCGQDLESFQVRSVAQAKSIVMQVAYALSVAERAFEFEHRDLHWGNVLIKETDEELVHFDLDGRDRVVESHSVRVSIIDFTLSRLTKDGVTVYVDLGQDKELFQGEGDIQFQVYRDMRQKLSDTWNRFAPSTNMLWVSYLIEKLTVAKHYGKGKVTMRDLSLLKRKAAAASSACDFVDSV